MQGWGLHAGEFYAWRAGNIESKRGIFFSIDEKGALNYGSQVKQYKIQSISS